MRIQLQDHGSIFLAQPQDVDAASWLRSTAPEDAQWWGHALVIEHNYVADFIYTLANNGIDLEHLVC